MSWYSHNTHYGIGVEINHWLAQGLNVVVNGSRGYLHQARELYPGLQPILISVYPEILRQRLEHRRRESKAEIERRLQQAHKLEKMISELKLIKVYNNGSLEEAGEQFIATLIKSRKYQCA